MSQYAFGSGSLWGINNAANSTPVKFGALQEVSIDYSFNIKELHGQYQFPLAVGRGTGKISGKAKFAQLNGAVFNNLFFGLTQSTGKLAVANQEAGTIPATPYQVTVANAVNFVTDAGVLYSVTGLPLTKVASSPTTGQYSVSIAGVYTFAAADTTLGVLISYTYNVTGSGNKTTIANQLLGTAPTFMVVLTEVLNSKNITITLNSCVGSKLSMPTKLEDFWIQELDFSAFADAAGNLGTFNFDE